MSRSAVETVITELQKMNKLGTQRRGGRRNISFDCPFHSVGKRQDTPSFGIQIETGEWNCFNPACGRKGPSIQALYASLTGIPEAEAEAVFPKDLGATDDLRRKLLGTSATSTTPASMAPYPLVGGISSYREAEAYMNYRRIPEMVWNKLGIRYCAEPWMASAYNTTDKISGKRIIFPIQLPLGNLGFMGRSIGDAKVPKWRPIENTGTFFYDPLRLIGSNQREVVLVEGEFSLAACVREGIPALGCFGSNIGADREDLLQQFDRILVFFDGDAAGRKGQDNALRSPKLQSRIVPFTTPDTHDPASLPLGFGPALLSMLTAPVSFSKTLRGKLHV